MPAKADDGLPTTATGSSLKGSAIAALRWVYPTHDLVTALVARATIGRAPSCTTHLESASVSRQHAEVKSVAGTWMIRDLDSKNGVFVNAKKVRESPLRIGDVVRLGDWVAVVEATTLDGLSGVRDLGHGVFGGTLMLPVLGSVRKAALAGSNLLIVGETGTGKALLARALHRFAARTGPFVVFDCTAGSENVREAELFGANWTTAEHTISGQVLSARDGTLLLDSPFDLPITLQAKLARVLERRPLGLFDGKSPTAIDVRCVAKTTVAIEDLPIGRIDSDLRRMFTDTTVRVPALRERRADIVPLFLELIGRHGFEGPAVIEPEVVEHLCLQEWPMNVRELDRSARRFIVDGTIGHAEPGFDLSGSDITTLAPARRLPPAYPASEVAALRAALERHHGNLSKAADELEITRSKAYRILKSAR